MANEEGVLRVGLWGGGLDGDSLKELTDRLEDEMALGGIKVVMVTSSLWQVEMLECMDEDFARRHSVEVVRNPASTSGSMLREEMVFECDLIAVFVDDTDPGEAISMLKRLAEDRDAPCAVVIAD